MPRTAHRSGPLAFIKIHYEDSGDVIEFILRLPFKISKHLIDLVDRGSICFPFRLIRKLLNFQVPLTYCQVGDNSFLGLNCTIAPRTTIGAGNIIGAGALIMRDTGPDQVYRGQASQASRVPAHRLTSLG